MAIRDTIQTLKNKEGTLTNNKVCNFAYDDTAYADDTTAGANGVITYNYNNHNNIPVKANEVIKVNPTVTSKGFRSQVSTLPRMLLNHIFGRVSYNLNKTVDTFNATLQALYNAIGQADGIATLDNTGRLPYSQLPLSAVEYKGAWNADTNTPALSSGIGTFGDEYIVSVQGTRNLGEGSVTYRVGDRVIYNGSIWQRIPSSSVRSVNSKTPDANGNVTVNAEDIVTPDVYGYDKTQIGLYWTNTLTPMTVQYLNAVCSHGKMIVIGGSSGGLIWSDDFGKSWSNCTISGNAITTIWHIYYFNHTWFLVGYASGAGIYRSSDGKAWQQCTLPYGGDGISSLATDGSKLIATESRNNYVQISTDGGDSWSRVPYTFTGQESTQNTIIVYDNGKWVIAINAGGTSGKGGLVVSSDGGDTWTEITNLTTTGLSLMHLMYISDKNLWVAGGFVFTSSFSSARLYTSTDALNWSAVSFPSGTYESVSGILYKDNNFIVSLSKSVGYQQIQGNLYKTSDFTTWELLYNANTYSFTALFYSDRYKRYLFSSSASDTVVSPDLSTWQVVEGHFSHFLDTEISILGVPQYGRRVAQSEGAPTNNVKTILDWLIYAVDNMLD